MNNSDCMGFLQWALPRLRMRWAGFRKIHGRVCKRITRRVHSLQLDSIDDYPGYLETHPGEWQRLDELCRITISRFYRDKGVFSFLEQEVFPALAEQALSDGERCLQVWSVGCASGEEPYTLALLWDLCLKARFPQLNIRILATDADPEMLTRAKRACYRYSSVKNIPLVWRQQAFHETNGVYCLKPDFRKSVDFTCNDVRNRLPDGPFHLILCRNLVFTYFDKELQREVGERICDRLKPAGVLVIGIHEMLPKGTTGVESWAQRLGVYRHRSADR